MPLQVCLRLTVQLNRTYVTGVTPLMSVIDTAQLMKEQSIADENRVLKRV